MLNIFPTLLGFGILSPFILRIALGLVMLDFGYSKVTKLKKEKDSMFESLGLKPGIYYVYAIGILEILIGLALIFGIATQLAGLFSAIISILAILIKKRGHEKIKSSFGFLTLCLVISLSLILTGAGFMAFDWPL